MNAKTQPPIEAGDILFFSGSNKRMVDRLIMRRTKSTVVHVAVALNPQLVIEAVTGGVRIAPLPGNWTHVAQVGWMYRRSNPKRFEQAGYTLLTHAGQRYGFSDIISQALMFLPGKPALSLDKSWDCSHLAVVWLQAIGMDLPFDVEPERVTPGDLYRWLGPSLVTKAD